MNTKEMLSVIELAKSLSFRETADRLFMTQPALSYQISNIENEIGFKIFERGVKGVALTPAGRRFVRDMESVYRQINYAVEMGQNFSSFYEKEIRVGLMRRSYFSALPSAIEEMGKKHPEVSIAPVFTNGLSDGLLKGELDVVIADEEDLKGIKGTKRVFLYSSPIKLLTRKDDVLTALPVVKKDDIIGRTFLVGSASRKVLRKIQLELEREGIVKTMNSDSHDTTLTLVSAGKAICLAPEFYKAEGGDCVWLKYDTDYEIKIAAAYVDNGREEVGVFLDTLVKVAPKCL
ncbi:MAG: LysR family transcriptional regulator [Clostridia bacterium]|nr:LysR family transcriptional regulator [Clostridia bacterium]